MIELLVVCVLMATVAGAIRYVGFSDTFAAVGRVVFFVAIVLFLISAVVGVARGRLKA